MFSILFRVSHAGNTVRINNAMNNRNCHDLQDELNEINVKIGVEPSFNQKYPSTTS